ncbi:MFS transporter [Desulfovibrio sp. AM18-2]|nr:MFS transporter [Desulfovibrio sp. AM18-2]
MEKRHLYALIGGLGAWTMDAMDMLLYVMSLTTIMKEFQISMAIAGMLASVTLLSSAFGGVLFGIVADKIGRKKSLLIAIAIYTTCTGLSALARSVPELVLYRTILGLGMGGAWAAGALLVNETWPSEHRGKASGFMQAGWALGYMLAAVLSGIILSDHGWRMLFLVGIIPSSIILIFIFFACEEPQVWLNYREKQRLTPVAKTEKANFFNIFKGPLRRLTLIGVLFTSFLQLAYWGLFTWLPGFLSTPVANGGAGMDIVKTSGWIFAMQLGALAGYSAFGFLADKWGRRTAFIFFLAIAAVLVPIYGSLRNPAWLFILGPCIGFFGSGYFSGFGVLLSELFPTRLRGAGLGFVYNTGRGVSALAPIIIGSLATHFGIGTSLFITSLFYLCGIGIIFLLPETKGQELQE